MQAENRTDAQAGTGERERIVELLAAVREQAQDGQPTNSDHLLEALGWSTSELVRVLTEAKARVLVWWVQGYGNPDPRIEDIEMTIQGRRLLEAERGKPSDDQLRD